MVVICSDTSKKLNSKARKSAYILFSAAKKKDPRRSETAFSFLASIARALNHQETEGLLAVSLAV